MMSPFCAKEISAQSIGTGINTTQDEQTSNITNSGHSLEGYEKSVKNQEMIIKTEKWEPTDYSYEDIKASTYTVQLGDTLWEIAEGYYGDANNWLHILELNSSSIGFLPDGTQALIFPEQILQL